MSNSTAVNKRLVLLFWLVMIVCLLPFVLLSFLNDMAADDFHYYNLYRSHGFWGVQGYVYHTWAGRYTTIFLNSSFVGLDVLHRYYWLPCLLLFVGTWGVCLFLSRTCCRAVCAAANIGGMCSRVVPASFVLFVLLLYVQAEIATGFYWFSSAIVYQPSMIFSLVLMGLLIRRFGLAGSRRGLDVLILLMMVLLCGCNEMAAVFLLLSLGVGLVVSRYRKGFAWPAFGLYFGVVLVTCILIASTSGVLWIRHKVMNGNNSILGIVPAVFFQLVVVLFSVFKEPLTWFAGFAVFLFGVRLSREDIPVMAFFRGRRLFLVGSTLLLLVVFFSLLIVMIGSGGSLPPRAINNLTGWVVIGLLVLCFSGGIYRGAQGSGLPVWGLPVASPVVLTTGLVLLLLASVNYRDAWQSVLSGYFHHAVARDRDRQLTEAGSRHQPSVTLVSYPEALEEQIHRVFPNGAFATVRDVIRAQPALLYPYDGVAIGDRSYSLYYGVNIIIVKK